MTVAAEPVLPGAHIAVLGAGIVGSACALELMLRGYRVTLIDKGPPGECGPSRANASHVAAADVLPLSGPGIAWAGLKMLMRQDGPLKIPAGQMMQLAPWLWQFWRCGRGAAYERSVAAMSGLAAQSFPALENLTAAAGVPDIISRTGAAILYESPAALVAAEPGLARRRAAGVEVRWWNAHEVRAREPALAPIFCGAAVVDRWGLAADPLTLTRRLAEAASARGARLQRSTVGSVSLRDNGVELLGKGLHVEADAVVIAAGVWSRSLARDLGDRLPLEAERGYNITYPQPGIRPVLPLVFAERGIVATSLDAGLRIGGWAEFGGLARPANPRWFARLRAIARELLPGLDERGAVEWMGHRPASPDSLPILSRSAASPRVLYACGHGHYGLTWSAVSAGIVADLLAGDDAQAAPFALTRF